MDIIQGFGSKYETMNRAPEKAILVGLNSDALDIDERSDDVTMAELEARLEGNARIEHYAALCGMSESGFRRLFREYCGCSPLEYRNALRLERARTLLQSGDYNVSEAAEKVGFSNLSFFIRSYKKKFGHTPKKE